MGRHRRRRCPVAGTLEKQLRLDRHRGIRRELAAGGYDTTTGHRLLIGDPRVCKVDTPGREKRYALVLVLDRSGSMRNGEPPKIEVPRKALARFAVAAEGLGIEVAIVDFVNGHARLVKPFSVETRHVQAGLFDTDCGGGTPLADALELARQLVENHRDEPLIVAVTDGGPSSVDDVIDQIRAVHGPVCSLTIATDTQPRGLSTDSSELADYYERETTVCDGERLDDRLDSYSEVSPSGQGVHVIVEGELPSGRNRRGDIEMYDEARFFTVTTHHIEGIPTSLERRQDALLGVHYEYVQSPPDAETAPADLKTAAGGAGRSDSSADER